MAERGAALLAGTRRGAAVDLLGIGQISLDRVAVVERLPRPGEKRALLREEQLPGGQVATALLAARRLGASTRLVGAVGDDEAGQRALAPLARAQVDVGSVLRLPGVPTRQAWVLVEREGGERTILERRSDALALPLPPLAAADVEGARLLLVDTEHLEASRWAAGVARRAGVPVVVDAERPTPAVLDLLREVDFPIVSRSFIDELSSGSSWAERLRILSGPATRLAVVTLGGQGSVARLGDRVIETPPVATAVVDTTGAGDVFRAGFACALLAGADAERALRFANAAGALGCRGLGAQGALPTWEEIEARCREP